MTWGSPEEIERRRRILVAAAAYAYEIEADPLVDDATFDALAAEINPLQITGADDLDFFFMSEFSADTGQWIHNHPDKAGVRRALGRFRNWRRNLRCLE